MMNSITHNLDGGLRFGLRNVGDVDIHRDGWDGGYGLRCRGNTWDDASDTSSGSGGNTSRLDRLRGNGIKNLSFIMFLDSQN